ncbi:hypothetical protein CL619_02750 [archaeon]|nr:hypothetical protein [archaeon]|tara:strand:- start:941 stop:2056 length:1116 start_codon:yes stop_codon:yes gene_type:complete
MAKKRKKQGLEDRLKSSAIQVGKSLQNGVNSWGPYALATIATAAGLESAIDNYGAILNTPELVDTVAFYGGLGALATLVLKPIHSDSLSNFARSIGNAVYRGVTRSKKDKFRYDTKRDTEKKKRDFQKSAIKKNIRSGILAAGLTAMLCVPGFKQHAKYAIGDVAGDVATVAEGIQGLLEDKVAISSNTNSEYNNMFETLEYKDSTWESRAVGLADTIQANKSKYKVVERKTGVPWYVIGAIHMRESSGRFDTYLHNGEDLGTVTKKVPKGIFFTDWNQAAIDALERHFTNNQGRFGTLEAVERYNGIGARKRTCDGNPVPTPYLWSGSQHYETGDYVADGVFKCVPDKQVGVAPILKAMIARGHIKEVEL